MASWRWFTALLLSFALATSGCDTSQRPILAAPAASGPGDPRVGAQLYATHCTLCHAPDPAFPSAIAPEIKGASRELIEARVLRGEYPAGYTPKRGTHNMLPLPKLAGDIDHLHAFLQQP